jgi:hypothetical protein
MNIEEVLMTIDQALVEIPEEDAYILGYIVSRIDSIRDVTFKIIQSVSFLAEKKHRLELIKENVRVGSMVLVYDSIYRAITKGNVVGIEKEEGFILCDMGGEYEPSEIPYQSILRILD